MERAAPAPSTDHVGNGRDLEEVQGAAAAHGSLVQVMERAASGHHLLPKDKVTNTVADAAHLKQLPSVGVETHATGSRATLSAAGNLVSE